MHKYIYRWSSSLATHFTMSPILGSFTLHKYYNVFIVIIIFINKPANFLGNKTNPPNTTTEGFIPLYVLLIYIYTHTHFHDRKILL